MTGALYDGLFWEKFTWLCACVEIGRLKGIFDNVFNVALLKNKSNLKTQTCKLLIRDTVGVVNSDVNAVSNVFPVSTVTEIHTSIFN